MRSKTIAGSLIAGLLLCTAATALYAETEEDGTPPDFRGIWARAPEPEFLAVPGDKSISHRYALLAALSLGRSELTNYAPGADCQSTLTCLRGLGGPAGKAW